MIVNPWFSGLVLGLMVGSFVSLGIFLRHRRIISRLYVELWAAGAFILFLALVIELVFDLKELS